MYVRTRSSYFFSGIAAQVFQSLSSDEFEKIITEKWVECMNTCLEAHGCNFEKDSTPNSFYETDSKSE